MKTNREMVVIYKISYEDDSEPITPKWAEIVQAHADWIRETSWKNLVGDGRVAINNVGVFEWEVIDAAETS